jgi:hypothetical protein
MKTLNLLCLLPPSHVETGLIVLKKRLFGDLGLASSLALPPFVPVAYVPDNQPRGTGDLSPLGIKISGIREHEGSLFADVINKEDFIAGTRDRLEKQKHPCIPVTEGIYLGCNELNLPIERFRDYECKWEFTVRSLSLITIHMEDDGLSWWKNSSWELTAGSE